MKLNGAPYYGTTHAQGNFISVNSTENQLLCDRYNRGKNQPLFISHRKKAVK
jgi:hypothetical protein